MFAILAEDESDAEAYLILLSVISTTNALPSRKKGTMAAEGYAEKGQEILKRGVAKGLTDL